VKNRLRGQDLIDTGFIRTHLTCWISADGWELKECKNFPHFIAPEEKNFGKYGPFPFLNNCRSKPLPSLLPHHIIPYILYPLSQRQIRRPGAGILNNFAGSNFSHGFFKKAWHPVP